MRLFIALDIDPAIRGRIAHFLDGVKDFAPEARWVDARSFHITLKFLGEKSAEEMEAIKHALASIHALHTVLRFGGTGFFPTARSPRVFWVGMEADSNLASLAAKVDDALSTLKIPAEEHPFTPHLTLARSGERHHPRGGSGRPQFMSGDKPHARFSRLHEKLAALPPPEFGVMTATEFFLYESKLSPAGANYTKLASFPLR